MNKKILIVEDDSDISRNLKEILVSEGYDIVTAKNGKEALTILNSQAALPNLIILDLMMPIMDGFAFREVQKNDPQFSGIPVVVMTADGHINEKKMKIGAADFIRKPPELEAILKVVDKNIR